METKHLYPSRTTLSIIEELLTDNANVDNTQRRIPGRANAAKIFWAIPPPPEMGKKRGKAGGVDKKRGNWLNVTFFKFLAYGTWVEKGKLSQKFSEFLLYFHPGTGV